MDGDKLGGFKRAFVARHSVLLLTIKNMNTKKYIGKVIMVGLTFLDQKENVIEQYQTHGVINSIDSNGMMQIERSNMPVFSVPFDEESISEAEEGIYKERATGVEVENPDFLTSWTINQSDPKSLENNKLYGFEPPDEE